MSWALVKLSEVCTLINGRAYSRDELLSVGKYEVLRVGNFFSNRNWYYSDLELPEDKYCENGDLLYAWSASFGPRIWEGGKVIYHYHIWKIVIDESKVDKKYLFHALKYDVERIKRDQGTGSTMLHVTKSAMEDRQIPFPPLPEQKRIAAILDKVDAICSKRQQASQLADEFLRGIFLEMFGNPVTNPKGWEIKPVGDICNCIVPGRDKPKSFTGSTPWITTNELSHLGITHKKEEGTGLSADEIAEVRARVVPKGSVIMTCVGDLGVVTIAGEDMVINQQLHAFLPTENLTPTFLSYSLAWQKGYMLKMASSTTLPYMNKSVCNSVPIMLPPKKLQEQFEVLVSKVSASKSKMLSFANEHTFQCLSHQAFSGLL